jgi:hypothetical protein
MAESKGLGLLRDVVVARGAPPLLEDEAAAGLLQLSREQKVSSLLLAVLERDRPAWAVPLLAPLVAERRTTLARTLGQIAVCARLQALLETHGIRSLPLKGATLAEQVYDSESDRPMSDVDLLALERWPAAVDVLVAAGFTEIARGDHAWAFRDPGAGGIVELHRSVVSAPGLFPLDAEGLWARSRPGQGQLRRHPSAEDLLVQLSLHAAFQHGLCLSLVQWLDFRQVLERERVDPEQLWAVCAVSRAEAPVAAALTVAEKVVAAPVPDTLRPRLEAMLPRGVRRFIEPRLGTPLAFVASEPSSLARVRWELLAGRRVELVWRTLVLPETPEGDTRLVSRMGAAIRRAVRLLRRQPAPSPPRLTAPAADVHDLGEPPIAPSSLALAAGARVVVPEVPFAEALLRDCLTAFAQVRLTVSGRCMEPALAHGDRVRLVGVSRRRPRVGDVVLARQPDGLRLHRLVFGPPLAPPGWCWRTKADRGRLLDPPLVAGDVLASVEAIEGRPRAQPRRAARALASLALAIAARLGLGRHVAGAEAVE